MTDEELKQLVASLAIQSRETDRQLRETDRLLQETARQLKETDKHLKETDKQVKEFGKQIGGLGEKFGRFTEGMALPSMENILREQFGMEIVSPSVRIKKNGQQMEIDVLSYANSTINTAYIVEVKSHLREEAIAQMHTIMNRFREFFPDHANKQVYGIIAAVHMLPDMRDRALKEGFLVARIHDEIFEIDVPADFQPKAY